MRIHNKNKMKKFFTIIDVLQYNVSFFLYIYDLN